MIVSQSLIKGVNLVSMEKRELNVTFLRLDPLVKSIGLIPGLGGRIST